MKLDRLFEMQRELDSYIQTNQGIEEDVFRKKGLALLVELSELANETRCFKFWSVKGPSAREVLLEEFVDSLHFILSLGIEKDLDVLTEWPEAITDTDLTELFLCTQAAVHAFLDTYRMSNYLTIWSCYGAIRDVLGFSEAEVIDAYLAKNKKNYDRQQQNY
ncbi:dUTP diphosphatase [Planococcus lenghuensis]|uniref:dUTPase n=1 Tax=Planococcus lenghuensis TaxID=2213202 RepID=A0A1Q2KX88_9BACL|nr:dUTP diphosphatase [Planococcus lenghuensis]AQQ52835.1 dUTPase [Planococcus lenghuensis]